MSPEDRKAFVLKSQTYKQGKIMTPADFHALFRYYDDVTKDHLVHTRRSMVASGDLVDLGNGSFQKPTNAAKYKGLVLNNGVDNGIRLGCYFGEWRT